MNDSFLYAHHIQSYSYNLINKDVYFYYNYFSEQYNTVNYNYLTETLNLKLSNALINESLKLSGTLVGVMASLSGQPSLLNVLTCFGILNVELDTVKYKSNYSSFFNAVIDSNSNNDIPVDYVYSNPKNYYFRNFSINDTEDYTRNFLVKKQLFNSIPVFLGAFYLYDKLRDVVENIGYYNVFNLCYTISSFIFAENVCYPLMYNQSNALLYSNALLQLNLNNCLLQRGQYYNIKYYSYPINSNDSNIHNVLFRNTIPFFNDDTENNNYISLVYKYIFHNEYINFKTVKDISDKLKKSETDTTEYIFDVTISNVSYKISFDNVNDILLEKQKYDNNEIYDSNILELYDNIIYTANYIFDLYKEYYNDVNNSSCSIKSLSTLNDKYTYYVDKINNIDTLLKPAKITHHDVGNLINVNNDLEKDEKYYLFAPFFGNYLEMLNINSAFLENTYSSSMAMLQLRYNSIYKFFCKNIDMFIEYVSNDNYIQNKNYNINFSELKEYNLSSVIELLDIPNLLSEMIPEQKVRGYFNKDVIN